MFDGVSFSQIFADQMTEFKDGRIVCLFGRKFYNEESDEEDSFYIVVFSNDNDQTQQYICEEVEDVLNIQEQLNGMLE